LLLFFAQIPHSAMAHQHTKLPACANCHYAFEPNGPDEFCPRCGQQNHEVNIGFGHVVEEFLEGVFHFDGKVFRTAGLLLFKPGQLTKRFLDGKRVPYVPPIRLYVFISFVFFALLSFLRGHNERDNQLVVDTSFDSPRTEKATKPTGPGLTPAGIPAPSAAKAPAKEAATDKKEATTSLHLTGMNFSREEAFRLPKHPTEAQVDSAILSKGNQPGFLNRRAVRAMVRWRDVTWEEGIHQVLRGASLMMFLLMPLAALLLKAAYFRQRRHYVSHLVFTVHMHCFLFVYLVLMMLLEKANLPETVYTVLAGLPVVYFLVALHTFYQQSWLKTLLKSAGLGLAYSFVLAAATVLVAFGGWLYF